MDDYELFLFKQSIKLVYKIPYHEFAQNQSYLHSEYISICFSQS